MNRMRSFAIAIRSFQRDATKQWIARFEQSAKVST